MRPLLVLLVLLSLLAFGLERLARLHDSGGTESVGTIYVVIPMRGRQLERMSDQFAGVVKAVDDWETQQAAKLSMFDRHKVRRFNVVGVSYEDFARNTAEKCRSSELVVGPAYSKDVKGLFDSTKECDGKTIVVSATASAVTRYCDQGRALCATKGNPQIAQVISAHLVKSAKVASLLWVCGQEGEEPDYAPDLTRALEKELGDSGQFERDAEKSDAACRAFWRRGSRSLADASDGGGDCCTQVIIGDSPWFVRQSEEKLLRCKRVVLSDGLASNSVIDMLAKTQVREVLYVDLELEPGVKTAMSGESDEWYWGRAAYVAVLGALRGNRSGYADGVGFQVEARP